MKNKRLFSLIMAFVIALASTVALPKGCFDESFVISSKAKTFGDFEYSILDDNTIEINEYTGSDAQVIVPTSIGGKKVTAISPFAFEECYMIESILVPDGVKEIGFCAFDSCSNLKSISLPDSITLIDSDAFASCTSLTSIKLPKNLTSISEGLFINCKSLEKISISNSITKIGGSAFAWCSSLKCISVPSSINEIGLEAFTECTSLVSIDVDSGNTEYSSLDGVLYDKKKTILICCPGKKTSVSIPESVKVIEESAFSGCKDLASVVIPDSVMEIGEWAFFQCSGLKEIKLPKNISTIEKWAFADCTSIECIDIPRSVTSLSSYTFSGCTSLTSITVDKNNTAYSSENGILYNKNKTELICCPSINGKMVIPQSVRAIADSAFNGCENLTEVILPDSLETIGDGAFFHCLSLNSITVPKSVTKIGDRALGCYAGTNFPMTNTSFTVYCYSGSAAYDYAKENGLQLVLLDAEYLDETISFSVLYQQSDSREMFDKVNSFRTGSEAWAWNEYDTEKTTYKDLKKYDYDYELEKVAMQRAAELVVLYSHTRPNGEICSTAYPSGLMSNWGENIAIGYTSADEAFEAWKEDNEYYSGQGHRRNMLDDSFASIGIAHVIYEDCDYWVQEFSSSVIDTEYKEPNNKSTEVSVEIRDALVEKDELFADKSAISLKETEKVKLPNVTRTIRLFEQWEHAPDIELKPNVKWSIKSGKDIVGISNETVISKKAGTAVLEATTNNKTVSIKVTVSHNWSSWKTIAYDCNKSTSTQTHSCSVCNATETKITENAITRLKGSGRFATAVAISTAAYAKTAETVVLANGRKFYDALAGVTLANAYKAPILLTEANALPAETLAEIKRLKAKKVIILGGSGSVGAEVKSELDKNGLKYEIVKGSSRFATAVEIANKTKEKTQKDPTEIFFVSSDKFADALSVSSIAALKNAPIIYLPKSGNIDDVTATYLKTMNGKIKNAYVIGGSGVIGADVMAAAAKALGLTVDKTIVRVKGSTKYDTCVEVNKKFADVLTGTAICVATGEDFPDALAGGVFAAIKGAPLFLAAGSLSDTQKSYLQSKNADSIYVFGGSKSVPDTLAQNIAKASV